MTNKLIISTATDGGATQPLAPHGAFTDAVRNTSTEAGRSARPTEQLSRLTGRLVFEDSPCLLLENPRGFMRVFLPHHCRAEFNGMHGFSFEEYGRQIAEGLPGRVGRRVAIAAPRGAAKSTLHSLVFPLMDLLAGRERHQVIVSATAQQAKTRLAGIASELMGNRALRRAFFGGQVPCFKRSAQRIELNGCRIEAFGAGSEMRGIAHGAFRPTRIILDDVEQGSRALVASHRRKLLRWYDEVIENLGDGYTHITVVGTILHGDGLLSRLLERPGYRGELYRSVMEWDRRPDLWRVWRRLFTEGGPDGEGPDRARAFFEQNRAEMLEGTRVLWPGKEPYEKLQERLLVAGRSAFFKEKQNCPIRDGEQIFDTATWARFRIAGEKIEIVKRAEISEAYVEPDFHAVDSGKSQSVEFGASVPVKNLRYFGFLDPALGKSVSRDGDYAAIVTIGQAPDDTLYVVDVWMERGSPMRQVEQVFALHQKYSYVKFGFESNGFQETLSKFFADVQEELKKHRKVWHLPVERMNNRHSKHSRIALLEPLILAGTILFEMDLPVEFFAQADEYKGNRSEHDDSLDALASCVEMIKTTERPIHGIRRVTGSRRLRF